MGDWLPWAVLVAALILFLWVDLHFFARGREPSFREGVTWSIGWLVLSLLAGVVIAIFDSPERAINYTTVYLIERSLSLDNLFVFILLFAYFALDVPMRGSILLLVGVALLGALAFSGLGLLTAARPRTIEGVSGLLRISPRDERPLSWTDE